MNLCECFEVRVERVLRDEAFELRAIEHSGEEVDERLGALLFFRRLLSAAAVRVTTDTHSGRELRLERCPQRELLELLPAIQTAQHTTF